MVGPWARGSLNGTPTSTTPARAVWARGGASSGAGGGGKPAVRYGISAARPSPRTSRQRAAMGWSDKIVADVDAVFRGVGDFDDGAREVALLITLREIGDEPGLEQRAVRRGHDPHHRPVHVAHVRVGAVDDGHLVGIEDDAGADGVDADQVDERLHDYGVVPAPGVLPH